MPVPLENLQERFEPLSLTSHVFDRRAETFHLELHAPYSERIDGDFYIVCPTCGWVSLALAYEPSRLVCPVGEAEAEGRRNRAAIHARRMV